MSKHRPLFKNRPNLQRLEAIAQQFNPMGICWAKLSDEDLNTLESAVSMTKKWTYLVELIDPNDNYEDRLDSLGLEGWELVSVVFDGIRFQAFFKRECRE
ncbi:MAG TPA: hypothetical protein V6C65_14130 [Allocoleopsis sp.]